MNTGSRLSGVKIFFPRPSETDMKSRDRLLTTAWAQLLMAYLEDGRCEAGDSGKLAGRHSDGAAEQRRERGAREVDLVVGEDWEAGDPRHVLPRELDDALAVPAVS